MKSIEEVNIIKFSDKSGETVSDHLTVEKALAIFLSYPEENDLVQLSITMRTPGNDEALALGFAHNEGIIKSMQDVEKVTTNCEDEIVIHLVSKNESNTKLSERNFLSNSGCGVCGKSSIEEAMQINYQPVPKNNIQIDSKIMLDLPTKLRKAQADFQQTGGIHAVGLFDLDGNITDFTEDVGRHNALDKLIGNQLIKGDLPLSKYIILLSGRVGYELVQKSLMAQIPILGAIGAPSSLCFELANKNNLTMIGFIKKNGFNLYTHSERIKIIDLFNIAC